MIQRMMHFRRESPLAENDGLFPPAANESGRRGLRCFSRA
jgi:hypothetical protein